MPDVYSMLNNAADRRRVKVHLVPVGVSRPTDAEALKALAAIWPGVPLRSLAWSNVPGGRPMGELSGYVALPHRENANYPVAYTGVILVLDDIVIGTGALIRPLIVKGPDEEAFADVIVQVQSTA